MADTRKYKSFWSFYPYYLTEHGDIKNRVMHFIGTALVIACFIAGIILQKMVVDAADPILRIWFCLGRSLFY